MLSNPVYSKPFRGAPQEVTGATPGREGAYRGENVDREKATKATESTASKEMHQHMQILWLFGGLVGIICFL